MGEIFRGASCVNVWLGGLDEVKDLAVEIIEAGARDASLHWFPTDEPCMDAKFLETKHVEALIAVLKHPWWSRLWTVQEAVLAKDLRFMVSGNSFSRKALFNLTKHLYHHTTTCCAAVYSTQPRTPLSRARAGRYLRFARGAVDVPSSTNKTKVALDRIYGVLGLLQDQELIFPDYSKTAPQVYEEAALKVIQEDKSLSLFSSLDRSSDTRSPLPSWVPDWDYWTNEEREIVRLQRYERTPLYNACDTKPIEWTLIHPGELMSRGVLFDQIDVVGDALETTRTSKRTQVYQNWHQVVENLSMRSHPYGSEGTSQVFHRTLCCDIDPFLVRRCQRMGDDRYFPAYRRWWAAMLDVRLKELVEADKEVWWYDQRTMDSTDSRRFFTTKKGYMGIAAENITEGDLVAVFNGAEVPHLLRPAGESTARKVASYNILSDAYVHGIMDGEAHLSLAGKQAEMEDLLLV